MFLLASDFFNFFFFKFFDPDQDRDFVGPDLDPNCLQRVISRQVTARKEKVSSDRLVKWGIKPATPGSQGKWFIHNNTAAPLSVLSSPISRLKINKLIE